MAKRRSKPADGDLPPDELKRRQMQRKLQVGLRCDSKDGLLLELPMTGCGLH
jgi:hypothetical protein